MCISQNNQNSKWFGMCTFHNILQIKAVWNVYFLIIFCKSKRFGMCIFHKRHQKSQFWISCPTGPRTCIHAVRNVRCNFSSCTASNCINTTWLCSGSSRITKYLTVWRASPIFNPIFDRQDSWHLLEAPWLLGKVFWGHDI